MSKLTIVPVLALLTTTACAADLSGDDDEALPPPDVVVTEPVPASSGCETASPDGSFSDSPMVVGIVPDADAEIVKLEAWVEIDPSGAAFSIAMQPQDAATGEPMGELQELSDIPIDDEGRFTIDEMVLELPPGLTLSLEEGQTALAEVRGGFCAQSGSIQGTYEGWTFTPTSVETSGVFFVAPVTAP